MAHTTCDLTALLEKQNSLTCLRVGIEANRIGADRPRLCRRYEKVASSKYKVLLEGWWSTQQDGKPGFSKEGGVCLSSQVSSGKARMLGDSKKQTKILSPQCLYLTRSYELHLVLPRGWEDPEPRRESQHRCPLWSSLQQAGQEGGAAGPRGQRQWWWCRAEGANRALPGQEWVMVLTSKVHLYVCT